MDNSYTEMNFLLFGPRIYGNGSTYFELFSLNIDNERKGYNMSPTKNRKRLFFNFHMKFMMYLDYSNWKFPIPSVGEGGKRGGKLSHCIDKPKFLLIINLSLLSSVVARSVTTRKVEGSNPAWANLFFSRFWFENDSRSRKSN